MNEENTRARESAHTDGEGEKRRAHAQAPAMEVVGVKLLPGDRRTPRALVTVRIGPVRLACSYARLRRGRWEVSFPKSADGKEGVTLPPKMEGRLVELVTAAAEADPAVTAGLRPRW
jgi:hypothetical protein